MCDPLTIAATAFTAYSTISQSNAQAAAVKQNAANQQAVNEYNAKQYDMAAQDAQQRGANDAAKIRENAKRASATLRAQAGSTGILADTGSYLDLQTQNAGIGAFDSLQTINNAEREAYGFKNQATGLRWQGNMGVQDASRQAKDIRRNGLLSAAAGTLVTGAQYGSPKFGSPNSMSSGGRYGGGYTTTKGGTRIDWFRS